MCLPHDPECLCRTPADCRVAVFKCLDERVHRRLPDQLECMDGLLPDIVARLCERPDQGSDCRRPDLAQSVSRSSPDDPVLILEPFNERLDERLTEISDGTDCIPAGIEIPVGQCLEEVIVALFLCTQARFLVLFVS